mmetsp:Transcript_9518/g.28573  ORF Transcript_9518/g.28573 Transcript_9518/m.28573 type:complete len:220 (+) Transcript_9518:226-885(+)
MIIDAALICSVAFICQSLGSTNWIGRHQKRMLSFGIALYCRGMYRLDPWSKGSNFLLSKWPAPAHKVRACQLSRFGSVARFITLQPIDVIPSPEKVPITSESVGEAWTIHFQPPPPSRLAESVDNPGDDSCYTAGTQIGEHQEVQRNESESQSRNRHWVDVLHHIHSNLDLFFRLVRGARGSQNVRFSETQGRELVRLFRLSVVGLGQEGRYRRARSGR